MHDYLVVELSGRIGNQLFQYASGLGIARRRGAELLFRDDRVPGEDLLLPTLIGTSYRRASPKELLGVGQYGYRWPARASARVALANATSRITHARRQRRHQGPPTLHAWDEVGAYRSWATTLDLPLYIQGHLQNERYFAEYTDEIFASIHWSEPPSPTLQTSGSTVAVSFRRGDYNSLGWSLPLRYYDEALASILDRVGAATIVLFGDDHDFVELAGDRFAKLGPVIDGVSLGSGALGQLRNMAACDHMVIANSSFAWWGAWLGDQAHREAGRIVMAPSTYQGGGDRIPDRWNVVPTTGSSAM